jgi:hypothetical protein
MHPLAASGVHPDVATASDALAVAATAARHVVASVDASGPSAAVGATRGRRHSRKRRLRSRNVVVDAWLGDDAGLADDDAGDTFADLEDFIVPDGVDVE